MKNYCNTNQASLKKKLNLTTQFNDDIISINKLGSLKGRTNKLIKTLTYNPNNQNSNLMTEDDIEKLFKKCQPAPNQVQCAMAPTKISTQDTEGWGNNGYKNFTNLVKFLKIDDEEDKFLTGVPERWSDQDKINQLFKKQQRVYDLTSQFKRNYLVGKIIGEGAYASVRVAIYKPLDKKIAIKIYEKSKIKDIQRKKSVRRQIKILELLNHPNVVKILDVVQTNNHLNIVMEYLSGTSLSQYMKLQPNNRISEKNCKKIFKDLTKALRYMHSLNIAHRDIKLQNVILDQNLNPKIIDFGFSTCIETDKKIKIFCGTPSYMAPEVVQKRQYRGQNADIWALGVMLFVSITGIFPFKGATDQELFKKINNSDYPKGQLIFNRLVSDLISKMLKIDPEERITASQALKHPWFYENTNDSTQNKNFDASSLENKRRVNTITSTNSKDSKWAYKTGAIKKILMETTKNDLFDMELKFTVRSPKIQQQINSYRLNDKQNMLKSLKNDKSSFRGKPHSDIKEDKLNDKLKEREKEKERERQKNRTHSKIIDILKMQMRKVEPQKIKTKKRC